MSIEMQNWQLTPEDLKDPSLYRLNDKITGIFRQLYSLQQSVESSKTAQAAISDSNASVLRAVAAQAAMVADSSIKIVRVSADTTLEPVAQSVEVDATSANIELTLPLFSKWLGLDITITKVDSSAHTVTWVTSGTGEVDGVTTGVLAFQGDSLTIRATGADSGHIVATNISDGLLPPNTVQISSDTTLTAESQTVEADCSDDPLTATLPPASEWIGLDIAILKVDDSDHPVTWACSAGDTQLGNETGAIVDTGACIIFRATGPGQIQIVAQVYPSGVKKSLAQNVVSATGTVNYSRVGNSPVWTVSGTITLPTDISRLGEIRLYLVGPDDSTASTAAGTLAMAGYAGATIDYVTQTSSPMWQERYQRGWKVQFHCVDDRGLVAATPYEKSVTVRASAVTSLTGSESADPRVADARGSASTKLVYNVGLNGNQVPQMIGLWYDRGLGDGWIGLGLFEVVSFPSGDLVTPSVPIPTGADGSWKLAAATVVGASGGFDGLAAGTLPSGAVQSSAISVPRAALNPANLVSNAQIGTIQYANVSGGWLWGWSTLTWDILNPNDPTYWSTFITRQKGHYSGSTWVPASDHEGIETSFAEMGKDGVGDPGVTATQLAGGGIRISVPSYLNWTVPNALNTNGTANADKIYKFRIYGRSMRGADDKAGGSGTPNQQTTCWAGSAAFIDLTITAPTGNIPAGALMRSTFATAFVWNQDGTVDLTIDKSRLTSIEAAIMVAASGGAARINDQGKYDIIVDASRISSITPGVVAAVANSAEFEVSGGYIRIKKLNVSKLEGDSIDVGAGGLTISAGGSLVIDGGGGIDLVGGDVFIGGNVAASGSIGCGGISVSGIITVGIVGNTTRISNTFVDAITVYAHTLVLNGNDLATALAAKLDSSTAASTYETQSHASSTYETQSHAASTYMPIGGLGTDYSGTATIASITSITFANGRCTGVA